MRITESQIRYLIRQIIVEEAGDKLEKSLDQVFDVAEDTGDDILGGVLGDIENLADQADEDPERFEKTVKESRSYRIGRINEDGGIILLGVAAAAPVILKGIGKLANVISQGLSQIDSITGADESWKEDGKRWEAWWSEKSESLHHAYIGTIEKIVRAIGRLPGINITDQKVHKVSEGIWTAIVAFLMIKSGAGIIAAVGKASYGIAGLEGALTAVKAGEIGVYIQDLLGAVA